MAKADNKKEPYVYFLNRKFEFKLAESTNYTKEMWHIDGSGALAFVTSLLLVPHNASIYVGYHGVSRAYDNIEETCYHGHEPFIRYWLDHLVDSLANAKFDEAYNNAPIDVSWSQSDKEKTRYKAADRAKATFLAAVM